MVQVLARVLLFILLCPFIANAQIESTFHFNGQNADVLETQKAIVVVTPEVVDVPSTCSRQVPVGEQRVCHNETRYDRQCSQIPPSQNCYSEPHRECRNVTRYRQECSSGPSRQVCTRVPSREVCTDRPSREVCTTNSAGRRSCTTVGGGRTCNQVGGGESCSTVPGERICRDVAYSDQECSTSYRNRCDYVPGREECRNVSYQVPVCRMEMQYRTEQYACTRKETVDRKTNKIVKNTVNVQVLTNGLVEEFPLLISVQEVDRSFKEFKISTKLLSEPTLLVYLQKKNVKVISETATEIILESNIVLEVIAKEMLPLEFPSKVISAEISGKTKKMTIIFAGAISAMGKVDMKITHKPRLGSTNTIAQLKSEYPSEKIVLGQVGNNLAMTLDLSKSLQNDLKAKKMKLKLTLHTELSIPGDLLNVAQPSISKEYSGTFVNLR